MTRKGPPTRSWGLCALQLLALPLLVVCAAAGRMVTTLRGAR